MIEVEKEVYNLLNNDNSGHGFDHIKRVLELSLKFAKNENADENVVALIALLHDVDDYKLFGIENEKSLTNAKRIMEKANITVSVQEKVISAIKSMGYSKTLKGIRPNSIEGKIVSDADMCDALGVNGILRAYKYSIKTNKPFFDRNHFPIENIDATTYRTKDSDSSVCHIFEKILKLKSLMLTESGKKEAIKRDKIVIDILYHLFDEENELEWKQYLYNYLEKRDK